MKKVDNLNLSELRDIVREIVSTSKTGTANNVVDTSMSLLIKYGLISENDSVELYDRKH